MIAGDLRFADSFGYTRADSGDELVIVSVSIINDSDIGIRKQYSQFTDFQLQGGSGDIRRPIIVLGLDHQLGSGELASGGQTSGWVAFEIRKGDRNLILQYHPCLILCEEQDIPLKETYRPV